MRPNGIFALTILALGCVFSPCRTSSAAADAGSSFPSAEVSAAIEKQREVSHAVGTAVVVVKRGAVVYAHGFGLRDLMRRAPVDPDTRFEIGSNTKQFTAAAILQLKEQGSLGLDDRLSKFVPAFPHANELTLRELLDQTSGLFDYVLTNHFVQIQQSSAGSFDRIAAMVREPLHFAPGSRWEYSNTNYVALGRVIEVVSGESYENYIRRHLFVPAGMDQTTTIDQEPHVADIATGYWRGLRNDGPLVPAPTMGAAWVRSAGEIVSTAGDLAKWDIALQSGKIVTAADFAIMTTPATLAGGNADDYGFGWWIDTMLGHKHVYHDGDTYGMSASNNLFPDDGLAVIVLENVGRDAAAKTAAKVFDAIVHDGSVAPARS